MSSEFDSKLRQLFAERDEVLEAGAFVASVLLQVERERRARRRRRLALAAVALVLLAASLPALIFAAPFLVTPLGWALSMLVGLWVMARVRWPAA